MTATSHTPHHLPTFADYQKPDKDVDLLPFVRVNQERTHWNHWSISRPATYEAQDEYGSRLAAHFVQYVTATNKGSGSPLLRDIVADMCQQYGQQNSNNHGYLGRFGGDDSPVIVAFFDFIEMMLASHVPPSTNVLALVEDYIQEQAEQDDDQPETPTSPFMIRKVVTNIPAWWQGEPPVIEYEAARWPAGGRIQTRQFKTLAEAEAWAKGSDYHG